MDSEINNILYGWMFHIGLDGKWAAIPKEKIDCYFNDYKCPGIIRSTELDTVIDVVIKATKDPEFLNAVEC